MPCEQMMPAQTSCSQPLQHHNICCLQFYYPVELIDADKNKCSMGPQCCTNIFPFANPLLPHNLLMTSSISSLV